MSTMEPPPRPTATSAPAARREWTRVEPLVAGRELGLWRTIAAVLVAMLALGTLLGESTPATCAFLLLVPAVMMASNHAVWWVRR